jgi:hypothetical protein
VGHIANIVSASTIGQNQKTEQSDMTLLSSSVDSTSSKELSMIKRYNMQPPMDVDRTHPPDLYEIGGSVVALLASHKVDPKLLDTIIVHPSDDGVGWDLVAFWLKRRSNDQEEI